MKKAGIIGIVVVALLVVVGAYALAQNKAAVLSIGDAGNKVYGWRYKMTVSVETPEGIVSGSAVRQMGNDTAGSALPEVGNPADVRGEAVVVDLGQRGVLFALISHQSDLEFYNAFPVPGMPIGNGGSSPEGIRYYASLPAGSKGTLNPEYPPGYPKLVMFKDINDPKSVTEAQIWERNDRGLFDLKQDRMQELFGNSVKLKDITLEITDESVTSGIVDKALPQNFNKVIRERWMGLPRQERARLADLVNFKQGK